MKDWVHFMLDFTVFVKKLYPQTSFNISESLPTPDQMDVLL